MDVKTLWELFQNLSKHVEVLNREVGTISGQIEWMSWWIRALVAATFVNGGINAITLVLRIRDNNKKKHG